MSFFVVPSVSYQTQQKLKKHKEKKDEKKEEKKLRKEAAAAAAASSGASIIDQQSIHKHHSHGHSHSSRGSNSSESSKKKKKSSGWSIISGRSSTSSKESKESKDNDDLRSVFSGSAPKDSSSSMIDQVSSYSNDQNVDENVSLYSSQSSRPPALNPVKSPSSLGNEKRFEQELTPEESSEKESTPKLEQSNTSESIPTTTPQQDEEETPSLIASKYGKSMSQNTFKQYKSLSAPTSHTISAPSKPTNTSTSPISPISPMTPAATFSHHSSIPYSPHSVRPRTNSAFSPSNTSVPTSQNPTHTQQHPHYLQNHAFHRNNSLTPSSSYTGSHLMPTFSNSKESKHTFRKLSFLGSNMKRKDSSTSLGASPGSESPGSSINSQTTNSYFPDQTTNEDIKTIPPFKPLLDLSVFNSPEEMQKFLLTPAYQVFRYNSFLSVVSSYHSSDALNFAKVRNHSLFRFIIRQQRAKKLILKNGLHNPENFMDLSSTENILAYYLYAKTRSFLRSLIKESSINQQLYNHEELVQSNFVNYVRYLINLPESPESLELTEIDKTHYEFKSIFSTIANALYQLKRDETTEIISSETTKAIKVKLLLECITKVSYEYILLEKYRFDMSMKFHNNHLIDERPLIQLFDIYKHHIKLRNKESPKVLLFNSSNSVQYGWYLSITIPFVRFIESHIYTESPTICQDYEKYKKLEESTIKTNFIKSDIELFDEFFNKLNLTSYQEYNSMSMDSLVKLNKTIENQSTKFSQINRREIPDPSNAFTYKPMNFEYYNKSLSTINDETFNLIQCQDLPFQVKKENYKTILREFYRILKPGGYFVCDSIHFGSKTTEEFKLKHKDGKFPTAWNYIDFSLLKYFEAIPNFVEVILQELSQIFGKGNVKFSITLLSSVTEVNKFLLKFGGMKLYELVGKFDEYCEFFEDNENLRNVNESSIHFGVHIEARKN
ncbi:uncharacterized protein KGF55_005083 [Candida pseudojiufengensis]|uniref:uncharacterized protein n=1 Tax=Candida pseudojiufengensis TaxID=497109 RepID=UPI0022251A20|nr:uncharacterized protein KGF55_005083 [Candida pseudojiufengensis]KAI5959851.1 hypothetical protein KGF55_005083 [Candida pseudojiufengensis]